MKLPSWLEQILPSTTEADELDRRVKEATASLSRSTEQVERAADSLRGYRQRSNYPVALVIDDDSLKLIKLR